jgi:hypothetical protein
MPKLIILGTLCICRNTEKVLSKEQKKAPGKTGSFQGE